MISLLSTIAKILTEALVSVLRALFSLLSWFIKLFLRLLKLFYCLLPLTAFCFAVLFTLDIILLISGGNAFSSGDVAAVVENVGNSVETVGGAVGQTAEEMLSDDKFEGFFTLNTSAPSVMFEALKNWWYLHIYIYNGSVSYILLLALTILMFIPVITIFLCILVFTTSGRIIFVAILADIAFYLLRALFGNSFIEQALSRYYRLFPEAGRKHEEREYDRNLKRRNREFKKDEFYDGRGRDDEYNSDREDEGSYDDLREGEYHRSRKDRSERRYDDIGYNRRHNGHYDDEYEDDYENEDDYDDEEFEENFDAEEDYRHHGNRSGKAPSSFNFFAGCNSLESIERKYRSLVKLYHPDNMDGDTAALQEINAQYTEAKKKWR